MFSGNLNLPPDCAPYVLVLSDVPVLTGSDSESFSDLFNKVCWWLDTFVPGHSRPADDVIMVRRVPWLGNGVKRKMGDCVVVNFKNILASNYVLSNFYARFANHSKITPLPLCFFYQQARPLIPMIKLRTYPQQSNPIHLENRFGPLGDLDAND